MRSLLILIVYFLLGCATAYANNISVSNVVLQNQNTTEKTTVVNFDLRWDNSWRLSVGQQNWDAAWVFVKYQPSGSQQWYHAKLKPTGHTAPTGAKIDAPADGMGAFVYRSAAGSGTFSLTDIGLKWDYAANGLTDGALVTVKVFAIEMVYVPQGAFYAGDFNTSRGSFKKGSASNDTRPWDISSENTILVTNTISNGYYYTQGSSYQGLGTGSTFTIPSTFPKGYNAFYCMKYEISEGQWVDFFNTLTTPQKNTLDLTSGTGKGRNTEYFRNTISWTGGDATTETPNRACGYLNWMDAAAYADWAGLRPMTELEFEKATRGSMNAIGGEYAWGNGDDITAVSSLLNDGLANEGSNTSNANANFGNASVLGPVRVGMFATASSDRVQAGASYWGIMELSGNVWERVVSVGFSATHDFAGTHGDGELSGNGYANVADWPGATGATNEVKGAAGAGFRGGSWYSASSAVDLRASDRVWAAYNSTARRNDFGFRAIRTAP
ncbi:SUMF1/EgtB/PvdO family nonheme iron enzyme [Pontibacter korlensis]|uniref:Sulfatase-modifying factor enzyme-like domain-containing protein n=1 Tax=Pontibacter korlensis TaxID=400092 RepID=A0A0E3ZCW9_9BACT|nr:SUMF1/EgtB/PvdO family nonheme iron enzyme [Pontibacter korlensis]AKD02843.1 hypothetical protein PKOR_06525 [Pontibacter korlensis]